MKKSIRRLVLVKLLVVFTFSMSAQSVTLKYENASLKVVLAAIKKQTGLNFSYSTQQVDPERTLSIIVVDESIDNVLKKLLIGTNLTFEKKDKNILIYEKPNEEKNVSVKSKKITGLVTDDKGQPIIGANIFVKGTSKGIITDMNGQFSLDATNNTILKVSYIGYLPAEVVVNNQSSLKITLKENAELLNEVVVVGYGTMKKSDLTGSVSSVKMSDVKDMPIISADQILQGRTTGVFIGSGGGPGAPIDIRVRGTNSVNAGAQPLYVIDGVPLDLGDAATGGYAYSGNVNVLSTLNPNDIAAMEVLKDASATAIYGARGSNGVILITTKKGASGKPKVEVEYYNSQGWMAGKLKMMNADQYAQMHWLYSQKQNKVGQYDPFFYGQGIDTDWQAAVSRQSTSQNVQVRVSGGTDAVKYNISTNIQDNQGILIGSFLKKINTRFNMDFKLSNKLKIGLNANISKVNDAWASSVNGGVDMSRALIYSPTVPVKDSLGFYGEQGRIVNTTYTNQNMVAIQKQTEMSRTSYIILGNAYLEYNILKGLDFRSQIGTNVSSGHFKNYLPSDVWSGATFNGLGGVNESLGEGYTFTNQLTYNKEFAKIHKINATAVYEVAEYTSSNSNFLVGNFFTNGLSYDNLGVGATPNQWASGKSVTTRMSYLTRINYALLDRYLFTFSARADGSSKFGANNKWGFFPSGAIAWKVAEEPFIKNLGIFDEFKLRGSYGVSGNDRIGSYKSLGTAGTFQYASANGLNTAMELTNMENPDLRWEKTIQTDYGVDFAFFKNKVTLTVDYFNKNTVDMLLNSSVPSSTGFTTYLANRGGMRITGWEFSLGTKNITTKDFTWQTDFNISFDRGIVTNLDGLQPFVINGGSFGTQATDILAKVEEGARLNNLYGYVQDGILPIGFQDQYQYRHMAQSGKEAGDLNLKDINNDGLLNQNDLTIIGNANPDFFLGFNNTLTYKNWKLNFFFQGSFGNDKMYMLPKSMNLVSTYNSLSSLFENRWTEQTPNNYSPGIGYSNTTTSFLLHDASYLRLQNISLSYTVPGIKVLGVNSLRVYATGSNLLTITKYPGYNPGDSQQDNLVKGFDTGGYPLSQSITLGAALSF